MEDTIRLAGLPQHRLGTEGDEKSDVGTGRSVKGFEGGV